MVSAYLIEVSAHVGCGSTEALASLDVCWVRLSDREASQTCSSSRILSIYLYIVCESKMARKLWDSRRCRVVCETGTREVSALFFLVLVVL